MNAAIFKIFIESEYDSTKNFAIGSIIITNQIHYGCIFASEFAADVHEECLGDDEV